ncbi:T9SS type A sorting domain-containing protein [Flavobacterium silvaticum]|uniref:T9SS type A sorting domain-containing protein n=1 Tax=Flavobacterium silvaticum TaxID=1852020 RepID=A0A972FR46_9FLAO|nr:T9SS type A sorting domain-containing protein [Flavobacterium silvaticum]NMH27829.1 T9SS type A sorting domain-containing protein [Flavobacterium silvaticum]
MKKSLFLLLSGLQCLAQNFTNGSLENWDIPCSVDQAPYGWTQNSTTSSGLEKYELDVCPFTVVAASDGDKYGGGLGIGTSQGEGIGQFVTGFTIGTTYVLTFDFIGGYYIDDPLLGYAQWHIIQGVTDVSQTVPFYHHDANWQTHQYVFTATLPSYFFTFRVYAVSDDILGSGGIDNFNIQPLLSLPSHMGNTMELVPNPVRQQSFIMLRYPVKDASLEVYNALGQCVRKTTGISGGTVPFDRGSLNSGIYFIKLLDDFSVTCAAKIVVE